MDVKRACPERVTRGGGYAGVLKAWDRIGKLRLRKEKERADKRNMGV